MDGQILEVLLKKIEEERKQIVENLADGVAKDHAEYQHLCGKIHGLKVAQREILEFLEKIRSSDE